MEYIMLALGSLGLFYGGYLTGKVKEEKKSDEFYEGIKRVMALENKNKEREAELKARTGMTLDEASEKMYGYNYSVGQPDVVEYLDSVYNTGKGVRE